MKLPNSVINLILLILIGSAVGCKTTGGEDDDVYSLLRLHLEVRSDGGQRTGYVPIYRANPVQICVQNEPFLDGGSVRDASVVEAFGGGFSLRIQFDERGIKILETVSVAHRNKRIAVYGNFSDSRWLAAPMMVEAIRDGVFIFTPDATREEAERLAEGLNRVAVELEKRRLLK